MSSSSWLKYVYEPWNHTAENGRSGFQLAGMYNAGEVWEVGWSIVCPTTWRPFSGPKTTRAKVLSDTSIRDQTHEQKQPMLKSTFPDSDSSRLRRAAAQCFWSSAARLPPKDDSAERPLRPPLCSLDPGPAPAGAPGDRPLAGWIGRVDGRDLRHPRVPAGDLSLARRVAGHALGLAFRGG